MAIMNHHTQNAHYAKHFTCITLFICWSRSTIIATLQMMPKYNNRTRLQLSSNNTVYILNQCATTEMSIQQIIGYLITWMVILTSGKQVLLRFE